MTRVLQGIGISSRKAYHPVFNNSGGAITRNETYHKLFAIYWLCHIVWISFAIFQTLQ